MIAVPEFDAVETNAFFPAGQCSTGQTVRVRKINLVIRISLRKIASKMYLKLSF